MGLPLPSSSQGALSLMLGPVLKTPLAEMPPAQAMGSGRGLSLVNSQTFQTSPLNNRHMCPAIIHPSLCVPVGCVCERKCVRMCEVGRLRCVPQAPVLVLPRL